MNRIILISCLMGMALAPMAVAEPHFVYFGTGGQGAKGIYRATFDSGSGRLSEAELAAEIGSPGFLALHPGGEVLYAVCRTPGGEPGVASFTIGEGGALTLQSTAAIGDGGGTHLAVSGSMLVTAQYGGGSVAVFSLEADGSIRGRSQLIEHEGGSGVVDGRQDSPHPHWCGFDPAGKFVFVPDLGLDGVVIYQVEPGGSTLKTHGFAQCPPGGGPRHMRFSPDGKFAYVLNELALSVSSFRYDAAAGELHPVATVQALADGVKAKETFNSAAEILVHQDGEFVYSSNRGNDSITAFRADQATGKLSVTEVEPIRGAWPRNINIDPSSRWILAAGAHSNTVSVFKIDQETGELAYQRGGIINVPAPICILFVK